MTSVRPPAERRGRLGRAVQAEIDQRIAKTVTPLAWSFGALFAAYALAHLVYVPPPHRATLVTLASMTSLGYLALAWRVQRRAPARHFAHPLQGLLASLALSNAGVHLRLLLDPLQTTNLALVQVAAGFLFLSWTWFAVATSVSLGFFAIAFHASSGGHAWNHFAFMLAGATAASTIIHALHLRAVRRHDRQRLTSDWQTQARLAQLETIAHLGHLAATELDPQVLMRACATSIARTVDARWVAFEPRGEAIECQVGSPLAGAAHEERIDVSGAEAGGQQLVVHFAAVPEFSVTPFLQSVAHLSAMHLRRTALEARRIETERALFQAQRMESIALLAGGIAHDFNNLLTVVLGHVDLLRHKRGPHSEDSAALEQVIAAVEAASRLTQQLLAFGRRQPRQTAVFDVRDVVGHLQSMLRRTISESIALDVQLAPDACFIKADRAQIEQVVMNLVVNARDALRQNGTIRIATERVELAEAQLRGGRTLSAGPYVVLSVRDNGSGIDSDALPHIFEPFFTTKGPERGTGLGLATVHGIVHQSGGTISVSSTRGEGTCFEIHLPAQTAPSESAMPAAPIVPHPVPARAATILVVEDNHAVRAFVAEALRDFGYEVLEAASGTDAIDISRRHHGLIDLLLSDMIMPSMPGAEVARALTRERAELKVLFVSGYLGDSINPDEIIVSGERYSLLPKPFTATQLRDRVEAALTTDRTGVRTRSAG